MEQCEDRVVPANVIVNVTTLTDVVNANDGVTSLREAVIEANANVPTTQHRITFSKTLLGGAITLDPQLGQLTLEKSTFIDGSVGRITVQRDLAAPIKHRIFHIEPNTVCTLARLTLLNGSVEGALTAGCGGGVRSYGSLTVLDCEIRGNNAEVAGGGIYADGAGASLDVVGSAINGNSAWSLGGGGIFLGDGGIANISNSAIGLNSSDGYGGGIFIAGSGLANPAANVTLNAVEVVGNITKLCGGGIYAAKTAQGAGTNLTLAGNTNIHDNIVALADSGEGGGVYFGRGTITLAGVTIANNDAARGDGMYRVMGTTIAPNLNVTYVNDQEMVGP